MPEHRNALWRRLHRVIEFCDDGKKVVHKNVPNPVIVNDPQMDFGLPPAIDNKSDVTDEMREQAQAPMPTPSSGDMYVAP